MSPLLPGAYIIHDAIGKCRAALPGGWDWKDPRIRYLRDIAVEWKRFQLGGESPGRIGARWWLAKVGRERMLTKARSPAEKAAFAADALVRTARPSAERWCCMCSDRGELLPGMAAN